MSTYVFKNLRQLFDKYAVARKEHGALVKSKTKIFSNFVAFSENPNFKHYLGCGICGSFFLSLSITLILKSTQYLLTAFNLKSSYPFLSFHQRHLARSLYGLSSKRCGLATTNSYLTTNEGFCKRFKAMAWPSLIWKGPRGPQWTGGLRVRVSIVTIWK